MADEHNKVRASKPKRCSKQAKDAFPPLPEPRPSTSGQQQPPNERGHRHASKGCSENPRASKASERDEHCRDRALQKICDKSACSNGGNLGSQQESNPTILAGAPHDGSAQTDQCDHLSLDNPALSLANADIWGLVAPHMSQEMTRGQARRQAPATFTPTAVGLRPSEPTGLPDPLCMQAMIADTIRQGIAASLQQMGRPAQAVPDIAPPSGHVPDM